MWTTGKKEHGLWSWTDLLLNFYSIMSSVWLWVNYLASVNYLSHLSFLMWKMRWLPLRINVLTHIGPFLSDQSALHTSPWPLRPTQELWGSCWAAVRGLMLPSAGASAGHSQGAYFHFLINTIECHHPPLPGLIFGSLSWIHSDSQSFLSLLEEDYTRPKEFWMRSPSFPSLGYRISPGMNFCYPLTKVWGLGLHRASSIKWLISATLSLTPPPCPPECK